MILIIVLFILICLIATVVATLNHPSFGRAPRGERLERIEHSPHYRDGQFRNSSATPVMVSDKGFFQNLISFIFGKAKNLKPEQNLPAVKINLHQLNRKEDVLVWLGHSSCFLQLNGKRFLIDPVLTSKFPASLMLHPFKGTDVYTPDDIPDIDYLIITHDHWDHLDYGTVKSLMDRIGKVVCPLGVGEDFEYWGYPLNKIVEMDWNDVYSIGSDLKINCLPTRHFSGRGLTRNKTLWASFMIKSSKTVYISGDGGYDARFTEIKKRFPQIDLAVMENGQYNKDWRYIHMMPDELPKAIDDLQPQEVMTVHNSKYALSKHPWYEPMNNIYKASLPKSVRLITPMMGETVYLDKANQRFKKWW